MAKKVEKTEEFSGDDRVNAALKLLNSKFGDGSVMTFNKLQIKKIEAVSTGSISLDLALGIGGLPYGRICEIFGPESSGKSTICLQVCAEAQKQGKTVCYLDLENAFDPIYAKAVGVNLDKLLFSQPASIENAFNMMVELLTNKLADVIIFDSVAAAKTKAEAEGEVGQNFIGLQARTMSLGLKKLTSLANEANCLCLFVNQIRMKIGVLFGNPETTPGGTALQFYASVRMRIAGKKQIEKGDTVVARETEVKVIKNKVAPPFRCANFTIRFGKGIDKCEEVLDYAVKFGLMEKSGAWYRYQGENVAQGKEKALTWLKSNTALMEEFTAKVKKFVLDSYDNMINDNEEVAEEEETLNFDPETGEIFEEEEEKIDV